MGAAQWRERRRVSVWVGPAELERWCRAVHDPDQEHPYCRRPARTVEQRLPINQERRNSHTFAQEYIPSSDPGASRTSSHKKVVSRKRDRVCITACLKPRHHAREQDPPCSEPTAAASKWTAAANITCYNMLFLQDTPVASGSVHSPWKQQVGARLARGALSVAYGMTEAAKVSPTATTAKLSGKTITVQLTGLGPAGVILHDGNKLGFEALGTDGSWHSTPITSTTTSSVTIGPAPAGAKAVRYLWYASPCSPYQGQPRESRHPYLLIVLVPGSKPIVSSLPSIAVLQLKTVLLLRSHCPHGD